MQSCYSVPIARDKFEVLFRFSCKTKLLLLLQNIMKRLQYFYALILAICESEVMVRFSDKTRQCSPYTDNSYFFAFIYFLFSRIFILLSRESDQWAVRARLGVASHLSTTPRWGNPAKCLSQRHNKLTCRLVLYTVPLNAERQVGKL